VDPPPSSSLAEERTPLLAPSPCGGARFPTLAEDCLGSRIAQWIRRDFRRSLRLLCAATGHRDVIDIHLVLCARERGPAVVTSDLNDISRVDPSLVLFSV
jgi:hypothetical protein